MPKLRNFSHSARQLGSSVGILSSGYRLRERITQILYLFRENATHLFPRKVHRKDTSTQANNSAPKPRRKSKPPPNVRTPLITADLDLEDFPEQMSRFAEDITTFLTCLNEFPEFADEVVNASILVFHGDLKVSLGTTTLSLSPRLISSMIQLRSTGPRALANTLVCPLPGIDRMAHANWHARSL